MMKNRNKARVQLGSLCTIVNIGIDRMKMECHSHLSLSLFCQVHIGFNVIWSIISIFTNEIKLLDYIIKNITKDNNRYNYQIPKYSTFPHSIIYTQNYKPLTLSEISHSPFLSIDTLNHKPLILLGISHSSSHFLDQVYSLQTHLYFITFFHYDVKYL